MRRPRRAFLPVVTSLSGPTATFNPNSLLSSACADATTGNQVVPEHPLVPARSEFASRTNVVTEDQVVPARPSVPVGPGCLSRDTSPVNTASSASFLGVPRHSTTSAAAISARAAISSVMRPQLRPDVFKQQNTNTFWITEQ
ncbi:MAG: hypothetical protein BYD32DRAFT_439910 [Podila humilis]|nr:MAG: hypothetical protein BYD32DRAFT_439910 [Podila humilis]